MTDKEIRTATLQDARQACLAIARSHSGDAQRAVYECIRRLGQMISPYPKYGLDSSRIGAGEGEKG